MYDSQAFARGVAAVITSMAGFGISMLDIEQSLRIAVLLVTLIGGVKMLWGGRKRRNK